VTADRAVVIFGGELKVEYLNLQYMRISSWSITNFVDWLLGSHIHFIISHIHQGIENFGWSVVDLYKELQRLKSHEGFPRENKLNCPVFTQDKMVLLSLYIKMYVMRTFQLHRNEPTEQVDPQGPPLPQTKNTTSIM
jgi:hypothetical protein